MKKVKLLALIASDAKWQYYNKYKKYLSQLEHPFRKRIDFYYDLSLRITAEKIREYAAVAFFYHDPLKDLYPEVYAYAKRIEAICNEAGIPFINQPDALSNTVKSVQLNLLYEAGFQVAKAFPFTDISTLINVPQEAYPLFIRIDAGHDSQGNYVQGPFHTFSELKTTYSPFIIKNTTHHQGSVAIQWIDTGTHHQLYQKFRCLVTKRDVIKDCTYFSNHWYIHGDNAIYNNYTEEMNNQFVNTPMSDIEKEFFIRANRVLNLDFCAYDYAYTKQNKLIIWEANPHPAFLTLSDAEPLRSQIVELLSTYYESFLPPIPWHKKLKQNLQRLVR